MDLFQFLHLLLVLCYDPFLGVPMRDTLLRTQVVHHSFTLEAKICLEGAMAIVEACMDDLNSSDRALVRERLDGGLTSLASEFLLLVSCPTEPCFSIRTVNVPSLAANWRAIASPTTPAPITWIFLM